MRTTNRATGLAPGHLDFLLDELDEGPRMLGRLQLGTVGRLEHEPDAVGHDEVLGSMPGGIVELQHNALLGTSADRLSIVEG